MKKSKIKQKIRLQKERKKCRYDLKSEDLKIEEDSHD